MRPQQIVVYLTQELKDTIRKLAYQRRQSLSQFVRGILEKISENLSKKGG